MKRLEIIPMLAIIVAFASIFSCAQSSAKAVTVPVTLDHNRIVIDVYVPLKDGTTKRVRGLVDTGRTGVLMSLHLAQLIDKNVTCATDWCTIAPPDSIKIGELQVSLTGSGTAKMPSRPAAFNDVLIPGMSPELILPSTILRNYDLVIDYANRQLTIGPPGSVKFTGLPAPVKVGNDGKLVVSTKIDGRNDDFGLDTGASASFVRSALFDQYHKRHPGWLYAVGSLGAANVAGSPDEIHGEMLILPAFELGPIALHDVLVASGDGGAPSTLSGVLGGDAFKGTRLGIDYPHSTIYVEPISSAPPAGLNVIGLTLRPEVDGRYTVAAVVPYEGQPSVADVKPGDFLIGVDGAPVTGATMGQVWSLLGGEPGQVRKLIIEREGKRLTVEAVVRRFLSAKTN
jgi:hypothetical protein